MEGNEPQTAGMLALTRTILANPSLWRQFRGEVFKWRRHVLYQWIIASPFIFAAVAALGMALSPARPDYSGIDTKVFMGSTMPIYPLGTVGAFAIAGQIVMSAYLPMFTLGFMLVAAWCVYSEYNWRTIKMVASRQPNRVYLVLAKVLFVAVMAFASLVTFTLSWLALGMIFKLIFHAPLGVTSTDMDVIWLGINHLALRCLAMFMWALPTMAVAYSTKSVIGGVILYFVYSGADSFLSSMGAGAINHPQTYAGTEGFLLSIVELAKTTYPYLLTSHLNRITMVATSPQVVASLPVAVSWLAVGVYVIVFIAITLAIFVPRDIKE